MSAVPGRRVLVTGSTHGIGFAIAEAFARAGARLVLNAQTASDDGAVARLSRLSECHYVQADLSRPGSARMLIDAAVARLGGLDTLVCNAGGFFDAPFGDLTEEAVDRTLDLNVKGYLFCAQTFAAHVADGQEDPSIVLIGSTNSAAAERDSVAYDTSKGAVLMLVRSLAVTLAPRVRVNGVGPGLVETPLTRPGLDMPGMRDTLASQIPLGRIGVPGDIGDTVRFLASPAAGYITGQMLYVDGGILAQQLSWGAPT